MRNLGPNRAGHILVAEDEAANLAILEEFLRAAGFDTTAVTDGEDAWTALQKDHDFAAVITDRMMPNLDGLELAKRIKRNARLRHIPIIMQTGAIAKEEVADGLRCGVYYYLQKPYEEETLIAIVRQAIQQRRRAEIFEQLLDKQRDALETFVSGEFHLRRPDEAENLAFLLGALFPDPARAMEGLYELLINAIEHGNLGITYEEKDQLIIAGNLAQEIDARLALPANFTKKVIVQFAQNEGRLVVTITDSGAGFDWRPFLDIDPVRVTHSGVHGIAKTNLLSFDRLDYIGAGNQVNVSSRLPQSA